MPFVCLHLALVDKLSYWPVASGRFRVSRPMSRASSSQNFEHPLPPPSRRFRAENAARHAAEISGDSRRKICQKVLKISAEHFLTNSSTFPAEIFPESL